MVRKLGMIVLYNMANEANCLGSLLLHHWGADGKRWWAPAPEHQEEEEWVKRKGPSENCRDKLTGGKTYGSSWRKWKGYRGNATAARTTKEKDQVGKHCQVCTSCYKTLLKL